MTLERATTPRITQTVQVSDAETGEPIANADVIAIHNFDWMDDWVMRATTDEHGVAQLRLAKNYMHLLAIHVTADGYLAREYGAAQTVQLYRGPTPRAGLRVPARFRGLVLYSGGGAPHQLTTPGERIWWDDLNPAGETHLGSVPNLGTSPYNEVPIPVCTDAGELLATPDPGSLHDGVAAWQIGKLTPTGPWGAQQSVLVIGDRDAAIAQARMLWQQYQNGDGGYIFNGWMRVVSPQTKISGANPYWITRPQTKT